MNYLVGVLIRFRKNRIALVADVEAMFHQVRVEPSHTNALQFLWWKDGDLNDKPIVCQMLVHLFGTTSSPSCANFSLRQTAIEFGHLYKCTSLLFSLSSKTIFSQNWTALFRAFSSHRQPSASLTKLFPSWARLLAELDKPYRLAQRQKLSRE